MVKLGIIIPTNNPSEYFSVAGATLQHLTPMRKVAHITVLFNFQAPWTKATIQQAANEVEALGFGCLTTFSKPPKPTPMGKLRHDAAGMFPEADIYMYSDDNLRFRPTGTKCYPEGSAERYLQVLDYMKTFPRCGAVMCTPSLGGTVAKYIIKPTRNGLVATASGLFIRNVFGGALYTKKECALKGGMMETMPVFRAFGQGYYFAKQFNNPTIHMHLHKLNNTHPDNHIQHMDKVIRPNAERYVREQYEDPEWTHEGRYFPKALWKAYLANGGSMDVFRTSKYWKDYRK